LVWASVSQAHEENQPGEVRVEVHAAAVNPSDIKSAEGGFGNARLPRILGRDFAGRVVRFDP
jgi:NADPH:quinone reductase